MCTHRMKRTKPTETNAHSREINCARRKANSMASTVAAASILGHDLNRQRAANEASIPAQTGTTRMTKFRAAAIIASFHPDRPEPEPFEVDPMVMRKVAKLTHMATRLRRPLKENGAPLPGRMRVAATPALEFMRIRAMRKRLIDPRTSSFATVWDLVTTLAIFFVAIVTPYEVCFLPAPLYVDLLFVVNRVVDCVFIVDTCINFFLIYSEFDPHRGRIWIEDHKTIVWHYLTGWFLVDVVSTLVSAFDIVALALDRQAHEDTLAAAAAAVNSSSSSSSSSSAVGGGFGDPSSVDPTRSLKLLKLVRGLRLVKLLRLLRGSRIFRRFETKMSIRYSTLDLLKCAALVVASAHWSACCWGLLAAPLFVEEPLDTWLGKLDYCRLAADGPDPAIWVDVRGDARCVNTGRVYTSALYWAFLLVTNTGYSDMAFRSIETTTEQLVSIVIIGVAQTVWAQVLATFTGIMIQSNPHTREFRHNMDQLNRFLREQPTDVISQSTRQRLREYMHQSRHISIDAANKRLIESMSPALQGEVAFKCNRVWLERVQFLRGCEPAFMVALSLELQPMVFAPGEEPMAGFLYIVHRGLALHAGKVLSAGRLWGEDMILFSAELRTASCAKAMNYLEVHMIGRDELLDLAVLYPRTYRRLRRQIAFLALRRAIIARAKRELALDDDDLLGERDRTRSRKSMSFKLESALESATAKSAEETEEEIYRQGVVSGTFQPTESLTKALASLTTQQRTASAATHKGVLHGAAAEGRPAEHAPLADPGQGSAAIPPPAVVHAPSSGASASDAAHAAAQVDAATKALLDGGDTNAVLRALMMGMEAVRVEVGNLRAEQASQREILMGMKQHRARLNRNAGNGATRSGGLSLSRPPDSRLARNVTGSRANPAGEVAGEVASREHFEA